MKTISSKSTTNLTNSISKDIIEETPAKEIDVEVDNQGSDKMMRDIQRLAVRLRSTIPCRDYNHID